MEQGIGMIWTSRYLFLHLPKTAGMSINNLLLSKAAELTFFTDIVEGGFNNAVHVPGIRHENLYEAESYFCHWNKSLLEFEKIFVVMRNPYDQELSQYTYLRQGHEWDVGQAATIAMSGSFQTFLESASLKGDFPPRLDKFFAILGQIPKNLRILRFENLHEDIRQHFSPYLTEIDLRHENRSKHRSFEHEYDAKMEQLCYRRNRWFFDNGYYKRLQF